VRDGEVARETEKHRECVRERAKVSDKEGERQKIERVSVSVYARERER